MKGTIKGTQDDLLRVRDDSAVVLSIEAGYYHSRVHASFPRYRYCSPAKLEGEKVWVSFSRYWPFISVFPYNPNVGVQVKYSPLRPRSVADTCNTLGLSSLLFSSEGEIPSTSFQSITPRVEEPDLYLTLY